MDLKTLTLIHRAAKLPIPIMLPNVTNFGFTKNVDFDELDFKKVINEISKPVKFNKKNIF